MADLAPNRIAPLIPAAYAIHLLDERFVPPGIPAWATTVADMPFSNEAWRAINLPSLVLVSVAALLVARPNRPHWMLLILAGHIGLHGIGHLLGSIAFGVLSPGVVTGLVFCVPTAVLAFLVGAKGMSPLQPER